MYLENEKKVLEAIFEYLATTGIEIDNNKFAIDTFQANNCTVTDDFFVKIPVDVAKRALSTTPKSFKWWNRSGDKYIEFGDGEKYVAGDLRAPTYYNPETKTVEAANSQALINFVKISNYFWNSDIRIERETVLLKKTPRARIRNFQLTAVSCIWRRPVPG